MEPGELFVVPSARLAQEDNEWASLASAEGADDELDDADCAGVVAAVDAAALELGRVLSSRMLAAKSALAQKGQARQGQMQAQAAAEQRRLAGMLNEEATARAAVEARLQKAQAVQGNLADALHETRESGAARLQAFAVIADWQRALAAQKREAYTERIAPAHARSRLLRKVLGGWRTASRSLRHARIDAFWEHSCVELREALQGHYEPQLAELRRQLQTSRDDAADAWQAKEELGKQLKAAFMRGVCQLNLETASILGATADADAAPRAPPPRPTSRKP
jgi:hypothetical protein